MDQAVLDGAVGRIQEDTTKRVEEFEKQGKMIEAHRLKQKVQYDMEMIREIGYCKGIENYSYYFDGRAVGEPPYSLMDYFPKDHLLIIDESHMTVPQVRGMYFGDQARKENLIEYGFRLPTARETALKFNEFERMGYTVFLRNSKNTKCKRRERKTLRTADSPYRYRNPIVEVRPVETQVQDLVLEIKNCRKERAYGHYHDQAYG
jgi:excinuclease ABC subunit B